MIRQLLALAIALIAAPALAQERIDASVAMSDGVQLAATLYLPAGATGRVPLLVRQHGGGSNKDSPYDVQYALAAVATGRFAALMYSHRGHGTSGGIFDFFGPRTTQDFSEMVDWVAATHGDRIDTERVAASGYSQGGGESLLPAMVDARVKALAVGNTFADLNHALNPEDCFKFSFATGIFLGAYTSTASRVDTPLAVRWGATFYADTEDVATPLLPSTTADLESRSPQTYVDALVARRVPLFWTNAWEDQLFPADHPERILATLQAAGVPVHYWFASGGHAAGVSFAAEETAREQAMLDWLDQHINGIDHGFGRRPIVDYWRRVTGNPRKPGEWEHHTAEAWPVPGAQPTLLHPQADGALGAAPAAAGATATLINDYLSFNVANDALVLELAANAPGLGDLLEQIPEDGSVLGTLTFTSAAVAEPLTVVGAPEVVVAQQSSHTMVQQLQAKVWDVGDEGARLIWRGGVSGPLGDEVRFKLWPNAHRFERGHRIVLTLSSVDFPTFKPDVEPWQSTVRLDGTYLSLPVVTTEKSVSAPSMTAFGGVLPVWALLLGLLGRLARSARSNQRQHRADHRKPRPD